MAYQDNQIFHMRWILLITIFIFGTNLPAQESKIRDANHALKNKEYQKALDIYFDIENEHKGSPGMYQNMAIAAAESGQDALAILYYEKVLKINPGNKKIKKDLDVIRKRNTELDDPPPLMFPLQIRNRLAGILTANAWASLSLFFLLISCTIFVFRYPLTNFKRNDWIVVVGTFMIFLLTFLLASHRNNQIYHNIAMIITASDTSLKKGPDQASPDISDLPAGSKVYIIDQIGQWSLVSTEPGDTGWIPKSSAKTI